MALAGMESLGFRLQMKKIRFTTRAARAATFGDWKRRANCLC
jgi:hypothetical protein